MDNRQREYLVRLVAAKQKALADDRYGCLEVCFELRLLPDLALYTRSLVCQTISDLSLYEEMPEKVAIAGEALRLARELKENESNASPAWIHEVNLLEKDAERCMQRAELDELDYSIYVVDDTELKPNEARLEDEMGALSVRDSNDVGGGEFEVHAIKDSDDEDIEEDMPQIEGLFTHRSHNREEVSIAEEHHTPQSFERDDMEVESDSSDSEFQMAQEDMSSSEDSEAEVGIRDQPITGFFLRSKSLPDVKQR